MPGRVGGACSRAVARFSMKRLKQMPSERRGAQCVQRKGGRVDLGAGWAGAEPPPGGEAGSRGTGRQGAEGGRQGASE